MTTDSDVRPTAHGADVNEEGLDMATHSTTTLPPRRHSGDGRRRPDYWHGLGDYPDMDRWWRRVQAYDRTEPRPLLPCYSEVDLKVERYDEPERRDVRRMPLLLENLAERHGEDHWYFSAPFCSRCRGVAVADASLRRWLVLHPGRTPAAEVIPATVPGDEDPAEAQEQVNPFLSLADLRAMPEPTMLVENLLPQGSYGVLTGRDGTLKTFLAIDLAMHIVTCRPWHFGWQVDLVNYGRVLYIAGEGVRSFASRIDAWTTHHGVTLDPVEEASLVIRDGAVDLYAGAEAFAGLLAKVRELEPDLIVVDTLRRSSGAAESNSATDMGLVVDRIEALKRASGGGSVLTIAHTGKSDDDARGSSAVEDDADFVLHVKIRDGRQEVEIAKMKDSESGQKFTLQPTAAAGSLVLREPGPDIVWVSDSIPERVKAVLFAARSVDPLSAAQVLSHVAGDATGKVAGRSSVYGALTALVDTGEVVKNERPSRAATFSLDRSAWPKDVTS